MTEKPAAEATSWKQWKLPQLNLGTLVSVLIAVGFITWQGLMIRAQIDDNSQAVGDMTYAVEELAGAVSLANELDTRTNLLFDEIGSLRDQYQNQADLWIEISTNTERAEQLRLDLGDAQWQISDITARAGEFYALGDTVSDLSWKVDDLERRVAEAFGAEMASGGDDYSWQISDLQTKVAEIIGRQNAGVDIEWKLEDLENGLDWEIDELTRRVTELQVRIDTSSSGGVKQWQVDDLWNHGHDTWGRTEDLYIRTDEMFDMIWRMWAALESRSWPAEYLYD